MNEVVCSICLIPAAKDREFFDRIISSLVDKYRTPFFVPHVTVYGVVRAPKDEIITSVDSAFSRTGPLSLKVTGLDYSDVFTKTLFVQFEPNPPLQELYGGLKAKLSRYLITGHEYVLNPHLSLIYKHGIPDTEKASLIRSISMRKEVAFDSCSVVSAPKPIEVEDDVKNFRDEYTKQL